MRLTVGVVERLHGEVISVGGALTAANLHDLEVILMRRLARRAAAWAGRARAEAAHARAEATRARAEAGRDGGDGGRARAEAPKARADAGRRGESSADVPVELLVPPEVMVVDLTALYVCDSTGAILLLAAARAGGDCNVDVVLAAPPSAVLRVLEVTGVLGAVPVYRTVPGAGRLDNLDLLLVPGPV